MVIEIDFNSDEAIYVQLMNQIIMGIATSRASGRRYASFSTAAGRYDRHQYAYSE